MALDSIKYIEVVESSKWSKLGWVTVQLDSCKGRLFVFSDWWRLVGIGMYLISPSQIHIEDNKIYYHHKHKGNMPFLLLYFCFVPIPMGKYIH